MFLILQVKFSPKDTWHTAANNTGYISKNLEYALKLCNSEAKLRKHFEYRILDSESGAVIYSRTYRKDKESGLDKL